MIYVTGDIHGEPSRLYVDNFPEQREMTRDDYVIIAGDFGLVWCDSSCEKWWLDWLDRKPFTTLFIDGNHENFDMLNKFPVVDFCGGKAHKIRENIYHLMRGYVFEIDGKKIFAFGGGQSHDIQDGILDPDDFPDDKSFRREYKRLRNRRAMFRIKGVSWWKEEMPSQEEMDMGIESLDNASNEVDFVITHCAPQEIASLMGFTERDVLTMYFNGLLRNGLRFNRWLFGHYHLDKQVMGKFICLYWQIVRIA